MLGSCIAVAVLSVLYEGLKVLHEYIDARSRYGCEADSVTDPQQKSVEKNNSSIQCHNSTEPVSHGCHAKQHKYPTSLLAKKFAYVVLRTLSESSILV